MRLALYCRVSTTDQDCSMQLRDLRTYAAARNWPIVAEYVDTGQSGAKSSRPELDRMMQAAKRREFDCLAVWKLDRLGRSLSHLITCVHDFASWGVRFIAVTQSIDTDQDNPTSRLILGILSVLAEFERDLIRERVAAGLRNTRAKGTRLGRPPAVVDRAVIKQLREQGFSLRKIAQEVGASKTLVDKLLKAG